MLSWIRWKFGTFLGWIQRITRPPDSWECYFCNRIFNIDVPRINAYKDGKPLYQCEECRIRLDLEVTPTDPKLFDSDG